MAEQGHEDGYEGPATLVAGGARYPIQVRLRGHFQPIDGRYHWYGRIEPNDSLHDLLRSGRASAVLTTPEGSAPCELSDPDPWQRYRVTGLSTPPYGAQTAIPELASGASPAPSPAAAEPAQPPRCGSGAPRAAWTRLSTTSSRPRGAPA